MRGSQVPHCSRRSDSFPAGPSGANLIRSTRSRKRIRLRNASSPSISTSRPSVESSSVVLARNDCPNLAVSASRIVPERPIKRPRGPGSTKIPRASPPAGSFAPRFLLRCQSHTAMSKIIEATASPSRTRSDAPRSLQGSGPRLGRGGMSPRAFSPFTTDLGVWRDGRIARSAGRWGPSPSSS